MGRTERIRGQLRSGSTHPRRRIGPGLAVLAGLACMLAVAGAAGAVGGGGTISLTAVGLPYTENFDTLASIGTSSTTPNGWVSDETGTNANTTYTAGTGSGNAGDTYSFGAAASTERAFGGLLSGSLTPTIGAQFVNNTGETIARLDVSYTGEQWRVGTLGRTDRLDFQISTDATSPSTGTWTDVDALDFTGPDTGGAIGARNGNGAANRTVIAASASGLGIPNGATFWIRWSDLNATGADDGLSVDDFSLTPGGVSLTITDISANEGDAGTTTFDFTVSLSSPAGAGGVTFDIATADNTAGSPGDFASKTLTGQTIPAGNSTYTFSVLANGDTEIEPDEKFFVDVTNVVGATRADGQGQGTILNDDVEICGDPATKIHDVQGSGLTSPLVGVGAAVEGVVVGDYQTTPAGFGGFFLEEEVAAWDADPLTSEGIFVFDGSFGVAVNPGDVVRVRGTVAEFNGLTELTSVSGVQVCSSGSPLPAPALVSLPVATLTGNEPYEGMLVAFGQPLTVTEVFTLGRFGEVSLSGTGRLYTPTAVTAPGLPAIAQAELNDRSRIILDDGNNQQNIDPTLYPAGGLSALNTLRVGDTLTGLTGVMDYRFNGYRIQPVGPVSFTPANLRTAAPDPVGGNLEVASFNVLNFFNGDGLGGGFPTARGASSQLELDRQKTKEVSALQAINADIVGLMEIENDPLGASAIEELVAALNAAMGAGTYAFVDTGVIGTDAIRVALIYKPAAVTPVGAFQIITSATDPRFIDTLNRPSLAQTFQRNANGARLTVVVNHLKSKGSDCNAVGDPDTGDGQGNCNLTRTNAAAALVDWLASDPTAGGDPDYLIIGDLNSYRFEDPITTLLGGGFTNLVAQFGGDKAYSYVFDGESGYLDHGLASASLASQATGAGDWHINADEPVVLDYNVEFKTANQVNTFFDPGPYRASDHDPVVIGLNLNAPPTVSAGGPYTVGEGGSQGVTASGGDPDGGTPSYAWDLDDNGSFETPGQNVTFSAAGIDGPATRMIHVRATDSGGLSAVSSASVQIENVAPSATFDAPASSFAGFSFALSLTGPSDPSAADAAAGFTYAFDCGSGYGGFAAADTASCPTSATGALGVGGKIRDQDGGTREYRDTVAVTVTYTSLCALTESLVTKDRVARELCKKLDEAERFEARRKLRDRDRALQEYRKRLDRETGKAVTAADAALLKSLSLSL